MSSENSNFYLGKSYLILLSTLIFLVIHLASSYIYTVFDIPGRSFFTGGVFQLIRLLLIQSTLWIMIASILRDRKSALAGFGLSLLLGGVLGFYPGTLIRYDNDNLLAGSLAFFLPFCLFGILHFKKWSAPISFTVMGMVPIANLSLGHRFLTNLSPFSYSTLLKLNFGNLRLKTDASAPDFLFGLPFDLPEVLAKTFLMLATVILFFEICRLLRGNFPRNLFSLHFNTRNEYSFTYSFVAYAALKVLTWYLIASLTVMISGNNVFPLLQNKVAQLIYLKGTLLMLVFCILYLRKMLSEQTVPGKPLSAWLFALSFLPVLDCLTWPFIFAGRKSSALSGPRISEKSLLSVRTSLTLFLVVLYSGMILYTYLFFFRSTPLNDPEVLKAAVIQFLAIPGITLLALTAAPFGLQAARTTFFFQVVSLAYTGFKLLPLTETVFSPEFLSFHITSSLVFTIVTFCLIPVFHPGKFYK